MRDIPRMEKLCTWPELRIDWDSQRRWPSLSDALGRTRKPVWPRSKGPVAYSSTLCWMDARPTWNQEESSMTHWLFGRGD